MISDTVILRVPFFSKLTSCSDWTVRIFLCLDTTENISEKVLVSSSYMDNEFHQCEEILDVPSECILLQSDVITNIEDAFLHMNILKQETSGLCSDQHSYFTTVSAFGK